MSAVHTLKLFSHSREGQVGTWSVQQLVDAYLAGKGDEVRLGAFSSKRLDNLQRYLSSYCTRFGTVAASDCARSDLLGWITDHPEWEATATRRDAVGAVVSCFRWAMEEFDLEIAYKRPKFLGPPVRPRPALVLSEFRAMRATARTFRTNRGTLGRTRIPFRALLRFLWATGCRPKEARSAMWEDIDWEGGVLVVWEHKTDKKTGAPRVIPIRKVVALLRFLQAHRRPGQRTIFANSLGRPWTCDRLAKEFSRYAAIAGVREAVSAYCLRHGLCSRLIEAGCSDRAVADVLGHKDTRYVSWYARSTRTNGEHLNATLARDRRRND